MRLRKTDLKLMQDIISLKLASCISEEGCSLDELVMTIREAMDTEGLPGLLTLILRLIDEHLHVNMALKKPSALAQLQPCCKNQCLHSKGNAKRTIRTSLGEVTFGLRELRCEHCRKTQIPLRHFLKLEPHQSKTVELEQMVMEVITEQSYRRTADHFAVIGGLDLPKSTLHLWVQQSDCEEVASQKTQVAQIMADSTGFKRRPASEQRVTNRGEIKVVLGIDDQGNVIPFGAWTDKDWKGVGKSIQEPGEGSPLALDLVTDGEPGLVEGLEHLAEGAQRCHWHMPRDLGHAMWQEDAGLIERKVEAKKLSSLLAIGVPETAHEVINEEERAKLIERVEAAEEELDELIKSLKKRGYQMAATYVSNAKNRLFTYLGTWLEFGIHCPRTNSLIERLMREIGRRLKKIGFGWSETGAAKMTRMILAKLLSREKWDVYWKERKNDHGNAIILFIGAETVSPR